MAALSESQTGCVDDAARHVEETASDSGAAAGIERVPSHANDVDVYVGFPSAKVSATNRRLIQTSTVDSSR